MTNRFLEEKIKLCWTYLTKREKEVAKKIINVDFNFEKYSITQIATKTKATPSLINRFTIKLGYDGFKHFNQVLKQQSEFKNKYSKILSIMNADTIYSIALTERNLNYEEMIMVAKKIFKLRKVQFYASGFAYHICEYHAKMYQKINIKAKVFNTNSELFKIFPDKSSVHIFVILREGKNAIKAFNKIKNKNQFTALITTNRKHILSNKVNACLEAEHYQTTKIDQFKLPIIVKYVIDYILNTIFIHCYNQNPEKFEKLI